MPSRPTDVPACASAVWIVVVILAALAVASTLSGHDASIEPAPGPTATSAPDPAPTPASAAPFDPSTGSTARGDTSDANGFVASGGLVADGEDAPADGVPWFVPRHHATFGDAQSLTF